VEEQLLVAPPGAVAATVQVGSVRAVEQRAQLGQGIVHLLCDGLPVDRGDGVWVHRVRRTLAVRITLGTVARSDQRGKG